MLKIPDPEIVYPIDNYGDKSHLQFYCKHTRDS